MQFTPKTEKEIIEANLWPDGIYSFKIIENIKFGSTVHQTQDTKTKADDDMIKLVVSIHNEIGESRFIIDYITPNMIGKLRNIAEACNILDKYDTGQLVAHDFLGKGGELKLGREKDKSGQYPDKNKIVKYIVNSGAQEAAPLDDAIPF